MYMYWYAVFFLQWIVNMLSKTKILLIYELRGFVHASKKAVV